MIPRGPCCSRERGQHYTLSAPFLPVAGRRSPHAPLPATELCWAEGLGWARCGPEPGQPCRAGPGRAGLPAAAVPRRGGSEGGMAAAGQRRTALLPPRKTTLTRRQEAAGPAGTNQAGPGRAGGGGGRGSAAGGDERRRPSRPGAASGRWRRAAPPAAGTRPPPQAGRQVPWAGAGSCPLRARRHPGGSFREGTGQVPGARRPPRAASARRSAALPRPLSPAQVVT